MDGRGDDDGDGDDDDDGATFYIVATYVDYCVTSWVDDVTLLDECRDVMSVTSLNSDGTCEF